MAIRRHLVPLDVTRAKLRRMDLWPGDWVQFVHPTCGPWCIRVVAFDRRGRLVWEGA